jgi:hypothetical protein
MVDDDQFAPRPLRRRDWLDKNAEPAMWFDPSDFSTLFQDAEGKIPVTAVGQPVGLWRSKISDHVCITQVGTIATLRQDAETGRPYIEARKDD